MRLSAIDIGSNAIRLLISDIQADKKGNIIHFRKVKLYRVPVRLGMDAFTEKKISPKNVEKLFKAIRAFKALMEVYEVEDYRACATSAMREADNSSEVIGKILAETGIEIHIIDGQEEAQLILSNRALLSQDLDTRFNHLYVDVGGGSTEISLIGQEGILASRSFKVGTIRLFKNMVVDAVWKEMENWLSNEISPQRPLNVIGSGGNINRIFKRSGNQRYQPIMIQALRKERNLLAALEIEDRIYLQDLNRDRAEVIVPALDIFLFVMDKTGIQQVVVPKIGVADGIVRSLFLNKI